MMKKALLIIDVQNDFLPGGKLAVKNGDHILPILNDLLKLPFDFLIATKDWHPENHISFAETHGKKVGETIQKKKHHQKLWQKHCVQNTEGSEFPVQLRIGTCPYKIIYKGEDPETDSYSAFFDNEKKRKTELDEYLKKLNIDTLYLAGLATEYCVLFTALDAKNLGYQVFVIEEACKGIDPEDERQAFEEMKRKNIQVISLTKAASKIKNL